MLLANGHRSNQGSRLHCLVQEVRLEHLAIHYAKAMGMRVIAIDGGVEKKKKLCLELGAEQFINFTTKDIPAEVTRITTHGTHGVIVSAGSREDYAVVPQLLQPGGAVVAVGIPSDPTAMAGAPPALLCTKRLNIVGTVTGTLRDVEEALHFTARGLVRPVLTHGTLHDVDATLHKMKEGKIAGRAVMKIDA